ncbi:redox-sensitive transcriptional activator SoxR [Rhodoplanes serenus]|uniref:Redox-sensitive transcriptional activator SoxR n=1 Tax=Rhodoplanes serenus TaxID=200615 RepID=A0A9X4XRH6_9BRAD|nr:redox-sensitive transcriptional activator SoxR [Rhodoplanes serenus]
MGSSPSSAHGHLTVGEVARRSGVAVSTVHFYEAKGLIQGWRTEGNQRRYPRAVLRLIAIIRLAQRAGIPLAVVKVQLDTLAKDRAVSLAEWRRLSDSWRAIVEERIISLQQLRDELEHCIGCGCLSIAACPIHNPDDALAREGPGPRRLIAQAIAQMSGGDGGAERTAKSAPRSAATSPRRGGAAKAPRPSPRGGRGG